jgi:hypothetical protein
MADVSVEWDALTALARAPSKATVAELLADVFECRHQAGGLSHSRRARVQSDLGLPDAAAAVDRVRHSCCPYRTALHSRCVARCLSLRYGMRAMAAQIHPHTPFHVDPLPSHHSPLLPFAVGGSLSVD